MIAVGVAGDELLGTGWDLAVRAFFPLALLGGSQILVVPLMGIYALTGAQGALLRAQLFRLVALIATLGVAWIAGLGAISTLWLYVAVALLLYAWMAKAALTLLRVEERLLTRESAL
jgi:hypothetical protein